LRDCYGEAAPVYRDGAALPRLNRPADRCGTLTRRG